MVESIVSAGKQLQLLSAPPQLDSALVGKQLALRIEDIGWCAGNVLSQSTGDAYARKYRVRFDAEDTRTMELRLENCVGSQGPSRIGGASS
jgi:hypothetical protein